jgi:hypothetical protein
MYCRSDFFWDILESNVTCTTQHMPMVFDNEVDVEPGSFAWLHGAGFAGLRLHIGMSMAN